MIVLLAAKFLSLFIKLMLCTKIKSEGIDSVNAKMLFHGELFKGKLYIQKYGLLLLEEFFNMNY